MKLTILFLLDTCTTPISSLSLHDALPIFHNRRTQRARKASNGKRMTLRCWREVRRGKPLPQSREEVPGKLCCGLHSFPDRKSTRLNSSHRCISYAVFCLKKKNIKEK